MYTIGKAVAVGKLYYNTRIVSSAVSTVNSSLKIKEEKTQKSHHIIYLSLQSHFFKPH